MSFEGKVALVTGASSGIGLATARRFAALGANVILSDVQTEAGTTAVNDIVGNGQSAEFVHADVSDPDSVDRLFQQVQASFGRLDFAFNNAGIEGDMGSVDQSEIDNWHRVIAINLTGVYYCMRHEIPLMKESGGGVIVNCSSIAGLVGTVGGAAYCASKHGLVGLTRAAALDHARENIRVNAVCPGAVDTAMVQRVFDLQPEMRKIVEEMQPIGRIGNPDEIAAAVIWLCQPESAFVTGIALPLDGAWTAR